MNRIDLDGQHAVVTGGAQGLGVKVVPTTKTPVWQNPSPRSVPVGSSVGGMRKSASSGGSGSGPHPGIVARLAR